MKTVGDPLQHHSTWHQHQHHHRHHQHHQPTPYQGEARSRMVGPELSVSSTIYSGGVGGEIITTICSQVGLAFPTPTLRRARVRRLQLLRVARPASVRSGSRVGCRCHAGRRPHAVVLPRVGPCELPSRRSSAAGAAGAAAQRRSRLTCAADLLLMQLLRNLTDCDIASHQQSHW